MRKAIALMLLAFAVMWSTSVTAAPRGEKYKAAVMEFGTFQDIDIDNLKAGDSEKTIYTMLIKQLTLSKQFTVIDRRYYGSLLEGEGLNVSGKIDPTTAERIGELLDVPYIICGNVMSIAPIESECTILSNGLKIYSVRARISLKLMDVKTGRYIKGATGNGTSSSSHVKVGNDMHTLNIGTTKVAQSSVTNALLKASEDAVEKLAAELSK